MIFPYSLKIFVATIIVFTYLCIVKIEEAIKQARFRDNYQKMIVDLHYTANWARDEQTKLLKIYDILMQHYNVLRIIKGKHPEPVSPGAIREVLIDKANDLTRLLDKLERKGWIKRGLCQVNRRKMDIVMTPQGIKQLEAITAALDTYMLELKKRITDKEADTVSRILDKLRG